MVLPLRVSVLEQNVDLIAMTHLVAVAHALLSLLTALRVNYVNVAKGQTLDGLDALGVVVTATEHLDPSLLGTAIAYIW